jgi:hypothetical protein
MFIFWLRKWMQFATHRLYRIGISTIRTIGLYISEVTLSTHLHLLQGNLLRGPVRNFRYMIFHGLKHSLHAACKRLTFTWLALYTTASDNKCLLWGIASSPWRTVPNQNFRLSHPAFSENRAAKLSTEQKCRCLRCVEPYFLFPYTPPQHRACKHGRLYCISICKSAHIWEYLIQIQLYSAFGY